MEASVNVDQSLLDITIQEHGNLDALAQIAIRNDISITDALVVDSTLYIPQSASAAIEIVGFFSRRGILPATAFDFENFSDGSVLGIGNMIIGTNFIVR